MKDPETLLGAVVIAAGILAAPFIAPADEVGRYEFVPMSNGDYGAVIYLLDTKTGETFLKSSSEWRLHVEPIQQNEE